ncbi:MAG: hypothetical protein WBO54_16360 [Thermoanaerobaculia bacterium]
MKQGVRRAVLSAVSALALLVTMGNAEAQVTILEVGPSATYNNIQDAINAAVVGDDTEIRVQSGTYTENLLVSSAFNAGSLTLLGGWDSTFTQRDSNPNNTIIDGNASGQVLGLAVTGGSFLIDGFTITNGFFAPGGGVYVVGSGDGKVTLRNLRIVGNSATAPGFAYGGGLKADLIGNQVLEVIDCAFKDNEAVSTGGSSAVGGGMNISCLGNARFLIQDCEIEQNSIDSNGGSRWGGGFFLFAGENVQGEILDSYPSDNEALGSGADLHGAGALLSTSGSALVNLERTGWALNHVTAGGSAPQLEIFTIDTSTVRISDSGFAQGDEDGVYAQCSGSSTLQLVNLTVADNSGIGLDLRQSTSSTVSLYNSISFGNGTDLSTSGTIDSGSNLIGVDPLFVDPTGFDYHLLIGSPAENVGDNSPTGDLGLFDFDGRPRIKDGIVDIGFMEGIAEVFIDGFESGDTTTWSRTVQ